MLLVYLSAAWLTGILLGTVFSPHPALIAAGLAGLPLFLFRRNRRTLALAGACLSIMFAGAFYYNWRLPDNNSGTISYYNDKGSVEIRGLVKMDPEPGEKTTHLYLSAGEILQNGSWQKVSGMVLIYAPKYSSYRYGDRLLVKGQPETPPSFDDFDYQAYLAHREIYSTMLYPKIEVLQRNLGVPWLRWIYAARDNLSASIARMMPEPQAALTQGIVLGLRGNITQETRDEFSRTGTAHLLAISGLHLGIFAGMMLGLGIWLFGRRRYYYVWLALGTIWLYALVTGLHPPVMRAAIMASIFLAGEVLGRQRSSFTALALAAAVMVAFTPGLLLDASFQMSFMAVTGLIFLFPPVRQAARKLTGTVFGEDGRLTALANLAADSISVSIAAIAAVWPLIAFYFGVIPSVGPLATILVLPVLPGIIISGMLSAGIGLVFLPLGQVIGWLGWLLNSWMLLVVNVFSLVPYLAPERFPIWLVWLYYPVFALGIIIIRRRFRPNEVIPAAGPLINFSSRRWLLPALALVAVIVWFAAAGLPDNRLHVSFLDVGEGDATLIQQGSRQVLVDGGPDGQGVTLGLDRKMPFWDRTIDLVVVTHEHSDHLTGLLEVLRRYRVNQVLLPPDNADSALYTEFRTLMEQKGIEAVTARAGQRIFFGSGTTIDVLNPLPRPLAGTQSDTDNNAIVLRLESAGISFLLTSDTMSEAETALLAKRSVAPVTVLKAGHHGSATSTTPQFLAMARPSFAVISAGKDNSYGHPEEIIVQRLEDMPGAGCLFRTDELGTVEFITDGERLWVKD